MEGLKEDTDKLKERMKLEKEKGTNSLKTRVGTLTEEGLKETPIHIEKIKERRGKRRNLRRNRHKLTKEEEEEDEEEVTTK